jgi:hypothetical protein
MLCTDVSQHSVCSIFISSVSMRVTFQLTPSMKMEHIECSETSVHKIQTPGDHPRRKTTTFRIERRFEIKMAVKSVFCCFVVSDVNLNTDNIYDVT